MLNYSLKSEGKGVWRGANNKTTNTQKHGWGEASKWEVAEENEKVE